MSDTLNIPLPSDVVDPVLDVPEQVLYQLEPSKCDETIFINVSDQPIMLPREASSGHIRLRKGDRVKSVYHSRMGDPARAGGVVIKGYLQAKLLKKEQLMYLEWVRRDRMNLKQTKTLAAAKKAFLGEH